MAYRAASSIAGRSQATLRGSHFDDRQPPSLPRGLKPEVRKQARDIFAANPHLWDDSQLELVVRLANMRAQAVELGAILEREGFVVVKANGDQAEHPAIKTQRAVLAAALQLEKALGIAFVARGSNVKAEEQKKPPTPIETKAGVPPLKLA